MCGFGGLQKRVLQGDLLYQLEMRWAKNEESFFGYILQAVDYCPSLHYLSKVLHFSSGHTSGVPLKEEQDPDCNRPVGYHFCCHCSKYENTVAKVKFIYILNHHWQLQFFKIAIWIVWVQWVDEAMWPHLIKVKEWIRWQRHGAVGLHGFCGRRHFCGMLVPLVEGSPIGKGCIEASRRCLSIEQYILKLPFQLHSLNIFAQEWPRLLETAIFRFRNPSCSNFDTPKLLPYHAITTAMATSQESLIKKKVQSRFTRKDISWTVF